MPGAHGIAAQRTRLREPELKEKKLFDSAWKRFAVSSGAALVLAASAVPFAAVVAQAAGSHTLSPNTVFYVPKPVSGAVNQVASLWSSKDQIDSNRIDQMINTPQAVWFNGGSPAQVAAKVGATVGRAGELGTVPILVAYNIPGRDCGQYSAGGALDAASYAAWIDGFAKGIGTGTAIVILEPDGLGLLPSKCSPPSTAFTDADRYLELNAAVDRLELQPNVLVYLDATHSSWLGVGDAAQRLLLGGVQRAQGFFLNVSNYQPTETLTLYGTWISDCIARTEAVSWYDPTWCPGQYSATTGYSLDWSAANIAYVNDQYASWYFEPTTHFVIDTSRNGQGPWDWATAGYTSAAAAQDWCNPPDRGVGLRPTANTGVPLLDAYLWVKIPGASDGSCTRSTGGTIDPEYGIVDPIAGAWFPEMALQLAQNANPAFVVPAKIHR